MFWKSYNVGDRDNEILAASLEDVSMFIVSVGKKCLCAFGIFGLKRFHDPLQDSARVLPDELKRLRDMKNVVPKLLQATLAV